MLIAEKDRLQREKDRLQKGQREGIVEGKLEGQKAEAIEVFRELLMDLHGVDLSL